MRSPSKGLAEGAESDASGDQGSPGMTTTMGRFMPSSTKAFGISASCSDADQD
jgi:hypothetical protein